MTTVDLWAPFEAESDAYLAQLHLKIANVVWKTTLLSIYIVFPFTAATILATSFGLISPVVSFVISLMGSGSAVLFCVHWQNQQHATIHAEHRVFLADLDQRFRKVLFEQFP